MLHRDYDSPRKLIWLETKNSAVWACSECAWFFLPIPMAVGNSFDLMTAHIQEQLETQFACHDCTNYPAPGALNQDRTLPILRKAAEPPLSHPGGTRDSDRARRPALSEPNNQEQKGPGDRVEGLGIFGKATGEFGTVEKVDHDDAVVKWDDDGRTRRLKSSLKRL